MDKQLKTTIGLVIAMVGFSLIMDPAPEPIIDGDGKMSLLSTDNNKTREQDIKDVPNYDTSSMKCDEVIKYPKYTICYGNTLKAATAVWYTLYGEDVNRVNIKKRPSFHVESHLPSSVRASPKDYTRTGFDRGHMAPDAAFDYDSGTLNSVYSMANIVPQYPTVNRHQWVKAERYTRFIARHDYEVEVINIIKFPEHPTVIGKHGIAVPIAFYKILLFSDQIRVFFYANEKKVKQDDKLRDHLIYSYKG